MEKPKKIAIKVENQREFNSLMRYYNTLGYRHWNNNAKFILGEYVEFNDNFAFLLEGQQIGFNVIKFKDFAKERNIKLTVNKPKPIKETVNYRDWHEFRKTGLFLFINNILHAFGWAIVLQCEGDKIISVKPARVKWRGFSSEDITESHERIANYLSDTAPNFPKEIE